MLIKICLGKNDKQIVDAIQTVKEKYGIDRNSDAFKFLLYLGHYELAEKRKKGEY